RPVPFRSPTRGLPRCSPVTGGPGSAYWARDNEPFSLRLGRELQPPAFRGALPVCGTPSLAVPGGLLLSRIAFLVSVTFDERQDRRTLSHQRLGWLPHQRLELTVQQVRGDRTRGLKQPPKEVGGERSEEHTSELQ